MFSWVANAPQDIYCSVHLPVTGKVIPVRHIAKFSYSACDDKDRMDCISAIEAWLGNNVTLNAVFMH